jgi:SCY1-like protein 2
MGQPDLDYTAPEIMKSSTVSPWSDMYSLGLLIAYIYNGGRSLIQSNHSTSNYYKQIESLQQLVNNLLPIVPIQLQDALGKLLSIDPRPRPSSQLLALMKYFSDPVVAALQFLDVITMKDPSQKARFYRGTLMEVIHLIPPKLTFTHLWPTLQTEIKIMEVLAAVLQPVFYIIQTCSDEEFVHYILKDFRWALLGSFSHSLSLSSTLIKIPSLKS